MGVLALAGPAAGQPRPYAQTWPGAAAGPAPTAVTLRGLPAYGHPAIPASRCRLVNAGRRDCVIPGMTAGRYTIRASGASMPLGAKPRQQLTIIVGARTCAQVKDFTAWTGAPRTVSVACEISVLTDEPITVSIVYADAQALKMASGPEASIERVQWDGLLDAREAPARPNVAQ